MHLSSSPFTVLAVLGIQIILSSGCMRYVPDMEKNDHLKSLWDVDADKKWTRPKKSCSCGTLRSPPGKESVLGRPWNALIRFPDPNSKAKVNPPILKSCGGTLINSVFILTAYSCFLKEGLTPLDIWGPNAVPINPSDIKVWFNVKDNPLDMDVDKSGYYEIVKVITNPNYLINEVTNGPTTDNVVLLKLKKEIDFQADSGGPIPICIMPTPDLQLDGTTVYGEVTGWTDDTSGNASCPEPDIKSYSKLNKGIDENHPRNPLPQCYAGTTIRISQSNDCKSTTKSKKVAENQFCMNFNAGPGLTNAGWSLSISTKHGKIMQLGIASWDDHVGNAAALRFFTPVSDMLAFINYFSNKEGASWCQEPEAADVIIGKKRSSGAKQRMEWENFSSEKRINKNDDCVCGVRPAGRGRIVGGDDATPHEFKWSVLMKFRGYFDNAMQITDHLCGGTLINNMMILTAAHCVIQPPLANAPVPEGDPANYKIYLAAHDKTDNQDGQLVKAKSIIYHPLFLPGFQQQSPVFDYDVALIELEKPVTFDRKTIMPICLPTSDQIPTLEPVGKMGWVTGWGFLNPDTRKSATTLQKIELKIQPLQYCNKIIPGNQVKATDRVLCAGTLTRFKDAAGGDSGGPMSIVVGERSDQFLQVGIVSYGHDVGQQTAGFYTDVRKVLSFIDFFSANAGAEWCPMSRTSKTGTE